MTKPILEVHGLKTYFYLDDNRVAKAVDDISLSIYPKETVALVGESGCGKSMTALSIMQLIDKPGKIINGKIIMADQEIHPLTNREMTKIRGKEIGMIFQEPMTALNPVFPIGNQITEIIRKHQKKNKKEAKQEAISLLKMVGIPRAEEIIHEYPHQLSGGMRQRVMIAMAVSLRPKLLIADEPTTALDVTIQAQILDVMLDMKETYHMALLLITHDLGVVSEYADRVLVMYGGQIVESGPTNKLLQETKHPYTKGLLESIPRLEEDVERLGTIEGSVPPAYDFKAGCRFSSRCPYVMDKCMTSSPPLQKVDTDYEIRCYLYEDGGDSNANATQ